MSLNLENSISDFRKEDDSKLWKELKTGNRAAFIFIYNRYVEDLIRYGCQMVDDKSLVEDIVQDLFVSLWEKKEGQSNVHSIKFYLLAATRRMLLRKVKRERRLVSSQSKMNGVFEIVPSYLDEKIERLTEMELQAKIRSVVGSLTERQREIIYLKFYQNLSYMQISEMLNLDQKYTYNLASRAFASFKEKFNILFISFFMLLS